METRNARCARPRLCPCCSPTQHREYGADFGVGPYARRGVPTPRVPSALGLNHAALEKSTLASPCREAGPGQVNLCSVGALQRQRSVGGPHADGGLAAERALVLADAATDAAFAHNPWLLNGHDHAVVARDLDALEQDGLLRHRAHLLAHDAVTLIGPRDTPILIDVGDTEDGEALLLQLQRRNRADRADLAARGTRVVTIPQAWHEHGSPQAFQSGLGSGRMDGAGRARAGALGRAAGPGALDVS